MNASQHESLHDSSIFEVICLHDTPNAKKDKSVPTAQIQKPHCPGRGAPWFTKVGWVHPRQILGNWQPKKLIKKSYQQPQ